MQPQANPGAGGGGGAGFQGPGPRSTAQQRSREAPARRRVHTDPRPGLPGCLPPNRRLTPDRSPASGPASRAGFGPTNHEQPSRCSRRRHTQGGAAPERPWSQPFPRTPGAGVAGQVAHGGGGGAAGALGRSLQAAGPSQSPQVHPSRRSQLPLPAAGALPALLPPLPGVGKQPGAPFGDGVTGPAPRPWGE